MSRSIRVRPDLIPRVKLALKHNGFLRQKDLVEAVGLADSTVRNFLKGKPVDHATFVEICQKLNLEGRDFADLGEIIDTPDLAEHEKAITKPPQESVETYAGSGKNLMSLATSMLEQLSFDEKFKKNITSSYTGYRLKNPGARAKKYLLVLAQRKEGLCISVSQDVLEPHILCLKYYEDEAPDIILGKFWIIPSKEDIFLASMQTHYPTLLDGEVTGAFTLNEAAFRFYHCIDIDNSIDFIDDSIDFIESPEEFDVNSLGSHDCYLVINEDQLFPDTLQVCIRSREILEEFIRYFGETLMENY